METGLNLSCAPLVSQSNSTTWMLSPAHPAVQWKEHRPWSQADWASD